MSGGSEQQAQQRWQGDATTSQSNSRSSPPAAPALPGIASFLQQPPSHQQERSSSSFRPINANTDHALRQQQQLYQQEQLQHHRYYHQSQQQQYSTNIQDSSSAAGFRSYTHLLDSSSRYHQRTPNRSPTNSHASGGGGSPTLSGFKNIAINNTSAASSRRHPSHDASALTSSKGLNEYPISSSTSTSSTSSIIPARTHVNYKPNVRKTSGGTHHRPLTRTSRYLREIDRRNILRRIEQGEKQANLAKEYQVSRAAISNLKQRRNRKDSQRDGTEGDSEEKGESESDSGSFHLPPREQSQLEAEQFTPERTGMESGPPDFHRPIRRTSSFTSDMAHGDSYHQELDSQPAVSPPPSLSPLSLSASSPSHEQKFHQPPVDMLDQVIQVSTATVEILFARLVNPHKDPRTVQITKLRIARLLLEHAMSLFPAREVEIPVVSASGSASRSSYVGVDFVKRTCAVSVSTRQEQAAADALVQEFQVIEPFSEIGAVSSAFHPGASTTAGERTVQLPQSIHESSVLVLVDTLGSRSVQEVAFAIQAILRTGAQRTDICLVTICSHGHALAYLLEGFPQLRIVTAKMLSRGDPSSNAVLELLDGQ